MRAIRKANFQSARTNLSLSVRGPVGDLTATLLAAWTFYGSGNTKGAIELIDRLQGTVPYTTSSLCTAASVAACTGLRFAPGEVGEAHPSAHAPSSHARSPPIPTGRGRRGGAVQSAS